MKIAVCEDSFADMAFLKRSIPEVLSQLNLSLETDYFYSGEELIAAVTDGASYSLLLLDVYMHSLDGIKTAYKIRDILPDVQIAFLTASQEFMLDAFNLNALHYLIKPIETNKLKECMRRFCERVQIPLRTLEIKSDFKTYTFPLAHVQKILSYNKGVDIYLQNEPHPHHIPISFIKAEEQLDPALFLRISRGFIVQMSYILCINNDVCRLKDGTEVLMSRREKANIRKKHNDYLFRR